MENKDPIEEALRYVANAEEVIQKTPTANTSRRPETTSGKVVSSPSTQCFTCAREKADLR